MRLQKQLEREQHNLRGTGVTACQVVGLLKGVAQLAGKRATTCWPQCRRPHWEKKSEQVLGLSECGKAHNTTVQLDQELRAWAQRCLLASYLIPCV